MIKVIKNAIATMWDEAFEDIPSDIHMLVFICNLMSTLIFVGIDYLINHRGFESFLFIIVAMVMFFFIYTAGVFARYIIIQIKTSFENN